MVYLIQDSWRSAEGLKRTAVSPELRYLYKRVSNFLYSDLPPLLDREGETMFWSHRARDVPFEPGAALPDKL